MHCTHHGLVNMVKVVTMAKSLDDALLLISVSRGLSLPRQKKDGEPMPIIALAMGSEGVMSRVMNRYFTPVTHPLLKKAAAPGQITLSQILATRRTICMHQVPDRNFFAFGYSMPQLNFFRSGFKYCKFPIMIGNESSIM